MVKRIENIEDPLKKTLYFMALLTDEVKKRNPNQKPILVGGSAVFIYTYGGHITYDLDLIIGDDARQSVKEILAGFGFKMESDLRHWFHEEWDLSIEIPGDVLAGDWNKISTIDVDGSEVYVIGLEDLLIDRLCAAKHWASDRDEQQSLSLLQLYYNDMDLAYLEERAKEEDVLDSLNELINKINVII